MVKYDYCILKDYLLDFFSGVFVVMWWIVFFKIYFSKPVRLSSFFDRFLSNCFKHVFF